MPKQKKAPAKSATPYWRKSDTLKACEKAGEALWSVKNWMEEIRGTGVVPASELEKVITAISEIEYIQELDKVHEEEVDELKEMIVDIKGENTRMEDELAKTEGGELQGHTTIHFKTANPLDAMLMEELTKCMERGRPSELQAWLETYQLM